ncbi:MAG: hypothetical protein WBP45_02680 [Daejeonella sp.]
MDIQKQIDTINSVKLDERISFWEDLIFMADEYLNSINQDETLALNIINCIGGIRTSRFIESDIDIKLLDASLRIARKLVKHKKILKDILKDILYYSNYYPEKYNKELLEQEIKNIN